MATPTGDRPRVTPGQWRSRPGTRQQRSSTSGATAGGWTSLSADVTLAIYLSLRRRSKCHRRPRPRRGRRCRRTASRWSSCRHPAGHRHSPDRLGSQAMACLSVPSRPPPVPLPAPSSGHGFRLGHEPASLPPWKGSARPAFSPSTFHREEHTGKEHITQAAQRFDASSPALGTLAAGYSVSEEE